MKWQMVKIKIPKRREMEELVRRVDANVRAAAALMVKRYQIVRAARELVRKEEELVVNPLAVAEARARLRALVTAAADLPAKQEAELAATLSDQRKRRAGRSLKLKRVTAKQVRARVRLRAQRRAMLKKAEELVAETGADLGVLVDATAGFAAQPGIAADLMRDWLDDN